MLPPSDSFLHQSLKLAEVTTNMQCQETLTPPPPYSVSQSPNPGLRETQSDEIDIDDDEASWDTTATNPNPVTVHIDASISVRGNSNTIIMSSGTGTQQPKPASTQSTTPPSPTTNSMTSATTVLQTAQKHRQNKLTEMATSIIAVLQSSRDLSQGSNGRGTLVEINVNTEVNIEGRKNVICAGTGIGEGRMLPRRDNNQNESDEDESGSMRKRRAQSVCSYGPLIALLVGSPNWMLTWYFA